MKVELTIKEVWDETTVTINGGKRHVEAIVDAIEKAFADNPHIEIK